MQINEVSVSMTHSFPGYNNMTVGVRAQTTSEDNQRAVFDHLRNKCLEMIQNEQARRDQAERDAVELSNAASLLRRNGFEVSKGGDKDVPF